MTIRCLGFAIASIVVASAGLPRQALCGTYRDAVMQLASEFAEYSRSGQAPVNVDMAITVIPKFRGLPSTPGGGGAGFVEFFKEDLAPNGILIDRKAPLIVDARLELNEDSPGAILVASVLNKNGREIYAFNSRPIIDDPKDLAELVGIPVGFGPEGDSKKRESRFREDLDRGTFFVGTRGGLTPGSILFSDRNKGFGICLRVNGTSRPVKNHDGLPYIALQRGETYELILINNTDTEVAANVKIDGVNVFHFSDDDARRPDGQRLKYWVLAPRSETSVKGWFKNHSSQLAFRITPVQEGAAAAAGISLEDVGLVTASFHASWTGDSERPRDEPWVERSYSVTKMVPETRSREVTRISPDGVPELMTKQYTVMVPVMETRVSTGFGEEFLKNTIGLDRTIGISRGVVAFRYDRGAGSR